MAGSIQPQAQSQCWRRRASRRSPEWGLAAGHGEPTGESWVVAGLFLMRVTAYFLISTLPIPQLHVPSSKAPCQESRPG